MEILGKPGLRVLFNNDNMIAFDKPAGLLVIPDQHTEASKTLLGVAQAQTGLKLWVVHRIDRGTTGVTLFAKNAAAHAGISRQFQDAKVEKTYLALLNGSLESDEGKIDAPIMVDGREVSLDAEGKPSITEYKVVERFRDFTLVEAYPGTGRRHQIRLHFLSLGHPLAVDSEYSGRKELLLSEFKKKYKQGSGGEKPLLARLSLHALRIKLSEPGTGTPVTVEAPVPHDLEVTLKQLRKYNR
jgi:RluA family pseudouridine synthase